MAALHIPTLPRSWKALIKRFIDDEQTNLFREKQPLLGKVSMYIICNIL